MYYVSTRVEVMNSIPAIATKRPLFRLAAQTLDDDIRSNSTLTEGCDEELHETYGIPSC